MKRCLKKIVLLLFCFACLNSWSPGSKLKLLPDALISKPQIGIQQRNRQVFILLQVPSLDKFDDLSTNRHEIVQIDLGKKPFVRDGEEAHWWRSSLMTRSRSRPNLWPPFRPGGCVVRGVSYYRVLTVTFSEPVLKKRQYTSKSLITTWYLSWVPDSA